MRRGLCVSSLTAPALKSDDDVLPVQELSHLGGAEAAGVKSP
jgi:hypothetical protein